MTTPLRDIDLREDPINGFLGKVNELARANDVISIASYGATGDGVTDVSSALTTALSDMVGGHMRLWLPPGTYVLGSTVTIPAGAWGSVFGSGATIKFDSSARVGLQLTSGSSNLRLEGITFVGDNTSANKDDKDYNFYGAVAIPANVTDVVISGCTFEYCTPVNTSDSLTSTRLTMRDCYVHNAPNGVHPPNVCTLDNVRFVCDSVVSTRGQSIYSFGSFDELNVINCHFENGFGEAVQFRAVDPHNQQKNRLTVHNCDFININGYGVWCGSDSHPDVGDIVLTNLRFKNCVSAIMCQGARSALLDGIHVTVDFEWPFSLTGTGNAVTVSTGIGLSGHYAIGGQARLGDMKFVVKHPWMGKITIPAVPANNDTLTVGDIQYTWKTTPSASFDIAITGTPGTTTAADLVQCAQNLLATLRGLDGRATAPCNALRWTTDVFSDPYSATYGTATGNVVTVCSGATFALSQGANTYPVTLTAPVDLRRACNTALYLNGCISPVVDGVAIEYFSTGISSQQNYQPSYNNCVITSEDSHSPLFTILGDVKPYIGPGCRQVFLHEMIPDRQYQNTISAAFPVIEAPFVVPQQLTYPSLGTGRSGLRAVGDGKAYTFFWYGMEMNSQVDATTLRFRWQDGDTVSLWDGATQTLCEFKRTAPGANQFNSADTLVALINATGTISAAYETFQNDLGATNPKLLIRLTSVAGGVGGNAMFLNFRRYKNPTDRTATATYSTVPQPLLNGTILRDSTTHGPDLQYTKFYGGAASLTKTFVFTPIVNANAGVSVQGYDAASQALAPVVYQADIIPGVGFYITHGAAAGTEKFFWRVN